MERVKAMLKGTAGGGTDFTSSRQLPPLVAGRMTLRAARISIVFPLHHCCGARVDFFMSI